MSDIIGQLEAGIKEQLRLAEVRAADRISSLTHINNILAQRCAAQAKEIARLISVYEVNPSPRDALYRFRAEDGGGVEMGPHHDQPEHPAVTAIAVMQKLGVR